jgi:hypothetical protein
MLLRICLIGLAMAVALPAAAQSPGNFDGTYAGLPSTVSGGERCPQLETPTPLTVGSGNAHSANGNFTGTVGADGRVVLHTKEGTRYDGQVDATGLVKVTAVTTRGCSFTFSWKKR